jgi:hypothetical protein
MGLTGSGHFNGEQLLAFVEGFVSTELRRQIERHRACCEACDEEIQNLFDAQEAEKGSHVEPEIEASEEPSRPLVLVCSKAHKGCGRVDVMRNFHDSEKYGLTCPDCGGTESVFPVNNESIGDVTDHTNRVRAEQLLGA